MTRDTRNTRNRHRNKRHARFSYGTIILIVIIAALIIALLAFGGCTGKRFLGGGDTQDPTSANTDSTVTEPGTSDEDTTGSDPGSTGDPAGTTDEPGSTRDPGSTDDPATSNDVQAPDIDLEKIKPDESGKIMVVMFHNYIVNYKPGGEKEWTTTLDDFRALLHDLYYRGYMLISLSDYRSCHIDVPAECIPMIFNFDDVT